MGLETTLKRPIINTRDEPHADADKYRRLHVIIGDANLAELSTYLKVGTTSLVLAMIEARALPRDLTIEEPVEALQAISHDPSLTHKVRLRDGRQLTALEVQRLYLEQAEKFVAAQGETDEQTADVLRRWAEVLDDLAIDPMRCADRLDWPAKLRLLEGYRSRDGLGWGDSRLHLVDLQYSDVRPDKGLYNRLVARGSMQRLLTDDEVTRAMVVAARRTPGRSSAASACGGTRRRWPRRPGTRSSSTSAGRTWCASRRWSRCGARASTWGRCSRRRRRPRSSSTRSPAADPQTPPGDPECHIPGVAFCQAPATSSTGGQHGHQGHRRAAEGDAHARGDRRGRGLGRHRGRRTPQGNDRRRRFHSRRN